MSESSNSKYYSPMRTGTRHSAKDTAGFSRKELRIQSHYLLPIFEAINLYDVALELHLPYTHELTIVSEPSIVLSLTTNQKTAFSHVLYSRTSGSQESLNERLTRSVNDICEEVERTMGAKSRTITEASSRLRSFTRELEWYSGGTDVSLPIALLQYVARVKEAGILPDDVTVQLREVGTVIE